MIPTSGFTFADRIMGKYLSMNAPRFGGPAP